MHFHILFISMVWTRWGRAAWDGLVKFRGKWLLHQWERVSLFKLRKQKKSKARPKITLVQVVKKDMSIKEVIEIMTLDWIEWHKRIQVADLN